MTTAAIWAVVTVSLKFNLVELFFLALWRRIEPRAINMIVIILFPSSNSQFFFRQQESPHETINYYKGTQSGDMVPGNAAMRNAK
jgi:hypothetical protein